MFVIELNLELMAEVIKYLAVKSNCQMGAPTTFLWNEALKIKIDT